MALHVRRVTSIKTWILLGAMAVFALAWQLLTGAAFEKIAHGLEPSYPVVINEIAPATGGGSTKWVELYNTSNTTVDISNWRLVRGSGNFDKVFPANTNISAHGYYVIESSDSLPLNAANLPLRLWTGPESTGAQVDTVDYGVVPAGQSYGREWDGAAAFKIFESPTKHAANAPDVTAPSVPTGGLPRDTFTTTNDLNFTWNSSTDDQGGQVNYEFRSSRNAEAIDSAPEFQSDILTAPTFHSTNLLDGVWYWQVRAIDAADNKSAWSAMWHMTIDTVKPSLEVVRPAHYEVFGGPDKQQLIVESVISDNSGLDNYHISLDDVQGMPSEEPGLMEASAASSLRILVVFKTQDFHEGAHTIQVSVTDKAGNTSEETRTIVIDRKAPEVNITAPTGVIGGTMLGIFGSVTDEAGMKEYDYQVLDGNKNETLGGDIVVQNASVDNGLLGSWDISGYPSGVYYVRAWAKDQASNASLPYEVSFTIDHTAPVATLNLTSSASPTASTPISLQGTVADFTTLKLMLGDEEIADLTADVDTGGNWQYTLQDGLPKGRYLFSVVATDQYENVSSLAASPLSTIEVNVGPFVPPADGAITANLTDGLSDPFVVPDTFGNIPSTFQDADQQPGADVLGAQTKDSPTVDQNAKSPVIAATEDGWRVFGMLWYWWLVLIVLVMGVWWQVAMRAKRQSLKDTL